MSTLLPMDDDTRGRLADLAARAATPENWYRPGEAAIPGDLPLYREQIGSLKVVFTWTVDREGRPNRHLSVSTIGRGLPHPMAVFTVAHLLGFTGARTDALGLVPLEGVNKDWIVHHDKQANCIVLGEPIDRT